LNSSAKDRHCADVRRYPLALRSRPNWSNTDDRRSSRPSAAAGDAWLAQRRMAASTAAVQSARSPSDGA